MQNSSTRLRIHVLPNHSTSLLQSFSLSCQKKIEFSRPFELRANSFIASGLYRYGDGNNIKITLENICFDQDIRHSCKHVETHLRIN